MSCSPRTPSLPAFVMPLLRIKDLLEAGCQVWLFEHEKAKLHAKATVIDRRWVSMGSANMNLRSHEFSKEANLIFAIRTRLGSSRVSSRLFAGPAGWCTLKKHASTAGRSTISPGSSSNSRDDVGEAAPSRGAPRVAPRLGGPLAIHLTGPGGKA